MVRLDAAGNYQWDKTFGGEFTDYGASIAQTKDGGYILGGYSFSGASGDKTENSRGSADFWAIRLDAAGKEVWNKTLGGHDFDYFTSLQVTRDGGFILGGWSNSGIGGEKTDSSRGEADYWIVKLEASGNKAWDKTLGGNAIDFCASLQQTQDGGYILGGYSISGKSGDKTGESRGHADFWAVKLTAEIPPPRILSFFPAKGLPGTVVTLKGQHLSTTRAILFHGQEASFEVISDGKVKATVPAGATSGNILVKTDGGQAASRAAFTVLHPKIVLFTPVQGRVGTRVYLVGNRLSTARDVYFNGVRSPRVKNYLNWFLSAVVPAHATTGKIKVVLQGGGAAITKSDFIVPAEAVPVMATRPPAPEEISGGTNLAGEMGGVQVKAYPNPFHHQVICSFTVAQPQSVVVKVYDLMGREVGLLYKGQARAQQSYQLGWRPPARLPGGLYIIRLQTVGSDIQKRIVLMR